MCSSDGSSVVTGEERDGTDYRETAEEMHSEVSSDSAA